MLSLLNGKIKVRLVILKTVTYLEPELKQDEQFGFDYRLLVYVILLYCMSTCTGAY